MPIRRILQTILGTRAANEATREADPDDIFGMSTAYFTMEAEAGFTEMNVAGICFSDFDSVKFEELVDDARDMAELGDNSTIATQVTDGKGYDWIIVEDEDFEELVTSIYAISDEFMTQGYGSRLIAAVFGFNSTRSDQRAYWIYSFKRGMFYPFCPHNDSNTRNESLEGKLSKQLNGELEVDDRENWYPIWSEPGNHPWE